MTGGPHHQHLDAFRIGLIRMLTEHRLQGSLLVGGLQGRRQLLGGHSRMLRQLGDGRLTVEIFGELSLGRRNPVELLEQMARDADRASVLAQGTDQGLAIQ